MSTSALSTTNGAPAVVVESLVKRFKGRRRSPDVVAVDDVSFSIQPGETLGLVGESGSGKSTVARCVLGLIEADSGSVSVLGRSIIDANKRELRGWRRDMQIVFQEPLESLSPRIRVGDAIAEPLEIHSDMSGGERKDRSARVARARHARSGARQPLSARALGRSAAAREHRACARDRAKRS